MVLSFFQEEENDYLFNGRKFKKGKTSGLFDINEKTIPAVNIYLCLLFRIAENAELFYHYYPSLVNNFSLFHSIN